MNHSHTNWPEFFNDCRLDPRFHELWWMDATPTKYEIDFSDRQKQYFVLSNEGSTMKLPRRTNHHFFDCVIDDIDDTHPFMLHFFTALYANQYLRSSANLGYDSTAGLTFDALMGIQRPHRDFADRWFQCHPEVTSRGIITYYKSPGNYRGFVTDLPIGERFQHSADKILAYQGSNLSYSQVIPRPIYEKTWLSVIFETNEWPRTWSHFTEKVAKPIIAKRPFIVLANCGYLHRLKRLGFRTFHPVIDESYDNIQDDVKRWTMALEQLSVCINSGRDQMLHELDDTLDHNKKQIDRDWYAITRQKVQSLASSPTQLAASF